MAFTPHRIDNQEIRAGDILVWKRSGTLSAVLSWLIVKLKEPDWGKDPFKGWHMTPMISTTQFIDAQSPRIKLSSLIDANYRDREFRAYRVTENPPSQTVIDAFVKFHVGRKYDVTVYLLTALQRLLRPFIFVPRLSDLSFDCWEISVDFCQAEGFDPPQLTGYDSEYPWLPDFLRCVGELPLNKN